MQKSEAVFALMNRTSKNWSCYTPSANQAVHRVAMTASRQMMKLLDSSQQAGDFSVSIADRLKVIEKAQVRFKKVAKERSSEGASDGEPRRALRDYFGKLLEATGMSEPMVYEFLFLTF